MVRSDLFHLMERSMCGAASSLEILHVCLAALLFCTAAAAVKVLASHVSTS